MLLAPRHPLWLPPASQSPQQHPLLHTTPLPRHWLCRAVWGPSRQEAPITRGEVVVTPAICLLGELTGIPRFIAFHGYRVFLEIEGLWQPCVKHVCWCHFSNSVCSLRVSVSHFGNSRSISNFFIIIRCVTGICDQ